MDGDIKEEADSSADSNERDTDAFEDITPFPDGPGTMITPGCFGKSEEYTQLSHSCPKCYDIFINETKFADHVLTHAPWYIMYVCGVCGLTLEEKDLLVKHILSHITPAPSYEFKSAAESTDHEMPADVLSENPEQSNIKSNPRKGLCSQKSPSTRKTKSKTKKRSERQDGMEYDCPKCFQIFIDEGALKEHFQMTHYFDEEEMDKKYQCDSCDLSFTMRRELTVHENTHHSTGTGKRKAHECKICGKKFQFRGKLRDHLVIHADIKPYRCDKCGKSFSWLNSLLRHDLIHTGVKPFVCEKCGKGFSDKRSIQCHNFREHNEDPNGYDMSKTHPCETCGKIFFTLRELKQHSVVHSGARPYECQTCKRTYPRRTQLNEHERTHTGETPFVCEICKRPFSRKSRLGRHFKLVHSEDRPHVCENCGRAYALRWKLRSHARTCSGGSRKRMETGQSSIEPDGVIQLDNQKLQHSESIAMAGQSQL